MEQEPSGRRDEAHTQIAAILVIADQLAVITSLLQQQVEAIREQNEILKQIAQKGSNE